MTMQNTSRTSNTNTDAGTAPIFWRLKDVLSALRLSKTFVYGEIKQGRFPPPVKVGSASVWVRCEVQEWAVAQAAARQR
jgi:prophage regulatory protein